MANRTAPLHTFYIAVGIMGIVLTYLFQNLAFLDHWNMSETTRFVLRKAFRVLLNDLFMLLIIFGWFNKDKTVLRLALLIQLLDSFVFLPAYLLLKISLEGTSEISSPLLSQFHRVIVNPTLMILLIPAVYFQNLKKA